MKRSHMTWLVVLAVLLLALVIVDISVRLKADRRPCLAIPTRFILEEPQCAEKLVKAANVSGVRIVSRAGVGG